MPNPNKTSEKINSFLKLSKGWHFCEGESPKPEIVSLARIINDAFINSQFPKTNAYCGANGEIQVNGYTDNLNIEIIIGVDKKIDLFIEISNHENYYENLGIEDILSLINKWGMKCHHISDSSNQYTMIMTTEDSPQWHSSRETEEYPSFWRIVQNPIVVPFANISNYTAQMFKNQRFSFESPMSNYQRIVSS